MIIHITQNGQQLGPYSLEDIKHYLRTGALSPSDLAWHEGLSGWVPLSSVPGVVSQNVAPPPPIPQRAPFPATPNPTDNPTGKAMAGLVLGIFGMLAWLIPLFGLPVTIIGLVMSLKGMKSTSRGMAVVGLTLSIIGLVLTIINSAIGAYQGATGQAWFQQ